MNEIIVAYWTGTGNTQTMAEYVAEGIREGGKTPKVVSVEEISADELKDAPVFALAALPWELRLWKNLLWSLLWKK